jgi:inorganic pyrophosphatase
VDDIPEYTKKEIQHFFEHYKDLEPGKWVKVDAWGSAADADKLVQEAVARLAEQGH